MIVSDTFRMMATGEEWAALFAKLKPGSNRRQHYYQYIASTAWKLKRAAVRQRSGGCCERCGSAQTDNVHHRSYAHLGNELLEELADLCRKCHEIVHRRKPEEGHKEGGLPPVVADIVTLLACRGTLGANPAPVASSLKIGGAA